MRSMITILFLLLAAATARATIDPDSDQIGVYFDFNADINCTSAPINVPFSAYVIITNPSAADVYGLEFHYRIEVTSGLESGLFRLRIDFPPGYDDFGTEMEPFEDDYRVGLASPLPGNGANVLFVTWQFLMLSDISVNFYLGPHTASSLPSGLPNYEVGGYLLPLGVSSGDINLPVASVNGDCLAVANTAATFGQVKSLFR